MAKSKYTLKSGPFSFVFWPEISTSLRDPLGCSNLSQIFFGSSLIATEWDKIVAEIIHKTFVFLRHPSVHMYYAQGPDQFSIHSLYSTDDARTTARNWRICTGPYEKKVLHTDSLTHSLTDSLTHTSSIIYRLKYS